MKSRFKLIIILMGIVLFGLVFVYITMLFTNSNEGSSVRDFLPFGESAADIDLNENTNTSEIDSVSLNENEQQPIDPLVNTSITNPLAKISVGPATKGYFHQNYLRFIERSTGHVFDVDLLTGTKTSISTTTVTGIKEAVWINKDAAVIQMYEEKTPKTALASIKDGVLSLSFLTDLADDIAVSGNNFVYTVNNRVMRGDLTGNTSLIATLPIDGWRITASDKAIYVYPKPSSGVTSSLYQIVNQNLVKIDSGSGLIAKYHNNNRIVSYNNFIPAFNINSIADKCAVGKMAYCAQSEFEVSGALPDEWYKGTVVFNDNAITKINFDSKKTASIEIGGIFDIEKMSLNNEETLLSFVDKKTGILWLYKLPSTEPGGVLQIELP